MAVTRNFVIFLILFVKIEGGCRSQDIKQWHLIKVLNHEKCISEGLSSKIQEIHASRYKTFIFLKLAALNLTLCFYKTSIEYGIFGEGSKISTNQKRESTLSSILIG